MLKNHRGKGEAVSALGVTLHHIAPQSWVIIDLEQGDGYLEGRENKRRFLHRQLEGV